MPYNLFIEHHTKLQDNKGKIGIGTGWEDDFTNILSFYLSCDHEALQSFCQLVFGEDFVKPISIETQVATIYGRPDIVITLLSGSQLIVECKVDACLQHDQLQRYLEIEPQKESKTYVALFCKNPVPIPTNVTRNIRYKSPSHGTHYFWTDLYSILPKQKSNMLGIQNMRLLFRNYLELIGFAPSSLRDNWSKLYEDRTIEENKKVQKLFGQKLSGIKAWLAERHFKVTAVSHSGLQAVPKAGQLEISEIKHITVNPERARKDLLPLEAINTIDNEVLRIALIFDVPEIPDSALEIYKNFPCPFNTQNGILWWATKPYKFSKARVRIDIVSNLDQYLKDEFKIEKVIEDSCKFAIKELFTIIKNADFTEGKI